MNILEGIEKEHDEIKYKGIDLTGWLQNEETVTDWYLEAHKVVPQTVKTFNLEDVKFIDIATYNENDEVVHEETRWEMSEIWNEANLIVKRPTDAEEATSDLIVTEGAVSDDPHEGVQRVERGMFKVGIKDGEPGTSYRIMVKFETESNRVEKFHFPVDVIEVTDVA